MATTKKKTARKKPPTNKPAATTSTAKKSSKKKTTRKKASSAKKTTRTKASSAKKTTSTTTSRKKSSSKKKTARTKASSAKTTSSAKSSATGSSKATARKKTSRKKTLSTAPGRSVRPVTLGNADECATLEECRGFIRELSAGARQMNDWLNDLQTAALSAEEARDRYAEQISDLVEALDQDQIKIAQLEAELKSAGGKRSKTCASEAVLAKLDELSGEIKALRGELKRVGQGRPMTASRRRQAERKQRTERKAGRKPRAQPGPLAKYDLISGAACSVGVGKYGYPPEVCAPAALPRSEAARVLGQYAQNNYAGLMEWATITGLPIRGGAPPAQEPTKKKQPSKGRASGKKATTQPKAPSASPKTKSRSKPTKSNGQLLNELLVTIQRI